MEFLLGKEEVEIGREVIGNRNFVLFLFEGWWLVCFCRVFVGEVYW